MAILVSHYQQIKIGLLGSLKWSFFQTLISFRITLGFLFDISVSKFIQINNQLIKLIVAALTG